MKLSPSNHVSDQASLVSSLNFTSIVVLLQISSFFICTFALHLTINPLFTENIITLDKGSVTVQQRVQIVLVLLLFKVFQQWAV